MLSTHFVVIAALSSNDAKIILSKIAVIEAHQRQHTVLLQHILAALQKADVNETCELPDGIDLPIIRELRDLEATLDDAAKAKQLVHNYIHSFKFIYLYSLGLFA